MQLSSTKLTPFLRRVLVDIGRSRKDASLKWLYDIFFGNISSRAGRAFTEEKNEFYQHYFRVKGEGIPAFLQTGYFQDLFFESLVSIMLQKRKATHDFRYILPDEEGNFSEPALKNLYLLSAQVVADMQQRFIAGNINAQTNVESETLSPEKKFLQTGRLTALEGEDNKIHVISRKKLRDGTIDLKTPGIVSEKRKLTPLFLIDKKEESAADTASYAIPSDFEYEEKQQELESQPEEIKKEDRKPEKAEGKEHFEMREEEPDKEKKLQVQNLEVRNAKKPQAVSSETVENKPALRETAVERGAGREIEEETIQRPSAEKAISPQQLMSAVARAQRILILNKLEQSGYEIQDFLPDFEKGTVISPRGESFEFLIEAGEEEDLSPRLYFINPENRNQKREVNPENPEENLTPEEKKPEKSELKTTPDTLRYTKPPIALPESRILKLDDLNVPVSSGRGDVQSQDRRHVPLTGDVPVPSIPQENIGEEFFTLPGEINQETDLQQPEQYPQVENIDEPEPAESEPMTVPGMGERPVNMPVAESEAENQPSNLENKKHTQNRRYTGETGNAPARGGKSSAPVAQPQAKAAPKKTDHSALKYIGGGAGGAGGALYWLFGGDSETSTAFINFFHNFFT